jgi:hypothetical protein
MFFQRSLFIVEHSIYNDLFDIASFEWFDFFIIEIAEKRQHKRRKQDTENKTPRFSPTHHKGKWFTFISLTLSSHTLFSSSTQLTILNPGGKATETPP